MIKGIYKVFLCFICLSLLVTSLSFISKGETIDLRGDLNGDKAFNTIDMVVLRRYFTNDSPIEFSNYSADLNIDEMVDIRDLVRMKKYFVGNVIHSNRTEDGLVWYFLQDCDGEFPIAGGVGFRFTTSCYVETSCLPDIYTNKIHVYVQTTKNPNPEIDSPKLGVGTVTINGKNVNMQSDINVITAPDVIWCSEFSEELFNVSNRSYFDCLFTVMLDGTVYPYRELKNSFEF